MIEFSCIEMLVKNSHLIDDGDDIVLHNTDPYINGNVEAYYDSMFNVVHVHTKFKNGIAGESYFVRTEEQDPIDFISLEEKLRAKLYHEARGDV